ncbi:MAG: hypothetical protein WAR22_01345 [Desulfomonilia bacterium]|jgi:hypothetical protein
MGLMTDLAGRGKDHALSRAIIALIGRPLARYGELSQIRVDSGGRTVELEILLKGEAEPVCISITRYEVLSEGKRDFVVIKEISVSREWMKALAEDLLKDRRFAVPHALAKILEALA